MATATVTISRALPTDTKHTVSANPSYHVTGFRPIVQQQPQQHHANQHGNNPGLMGQQETPPSETSSQTASPTQAALPAGQLQLPTVQPAQHVQPAPAARPHGPVSAARVLPPRAKPGRKPMDQDNATDRRKSQNRQAQRNFRDKRAQKVDHLQESLRDLTARFEQAQQDWANKQHGYQERINNLQNDLRVSNDKAAAFERKFNEADAARQVAEREVAQLRELHSRDVSKQMGFPNSILQTAGPSMAALPPISNTMDITMHHVHIDQAPDPYAEQEIDITAQWSNGMFNKGPSATNNQVDWSGSDMDIDKAIGGPCGFCNDSETCPCRETRKPKPTLAPGGCDACIADPERAARCKALAERAEVSQRPTAEQRHDSIAQRAEYVSCSKLFDRTNPPLPSISDLFPGTFHAYPSQNSAAGFDVNEHEVARVLQNLRNNGSAGGAPPA